jgi:hypothetical protein
MVLASCSRFSLFFVRMALSWWEAALRLDLEQVWEWGGGAKPWLHLYADAAGAPPRLAAVLLHDGELHFCQCDVPERLARQFVHRDDAQIMGLEMLALALGLSSFGGWLQGRRILLWSDNKGAELVTRKGSARRFDHTCLAHSLWTCLVRLKAEAFVRRVPSAFNIADGPSRGDVSLLGQLGAKEVPARLDGIFWAPGAWASISQSIRGSRPSTTHEVIEID